MTQSEQKLEKAIKMLREEYDRAQSTCYVRKPMSYALYRVWRKFDVSEKGRLNREENK